VGDTVVIIERLDKDIAGLYLNLKQPKTTLQLRYSMQSAVQVHMKVRAARRAWWIIVKKVGRYSRIGFY